MCNSQWYKLSTLVEIRSQWLNLFGERWKDDNNNELDYWRVEKADSVIVIPLWRNSIVIPPAFFRVGINQFTLDFPGGRMDEGETLNKIATQILVRELGLSEDSILKIDSLNRDGWFINSSFSNQKLYGLVAEIADSYSIISEKIAFTVPHTIDGIQILLSKLTCLQCRAVLLEWLKTQQ